MSSLGETERASELAQRPSPGVRMKIDLRVHPVEHRVAVQVMLEPVRSYVSGTISGTGPCL